MAKLSLTPIGSRYGSIDALNANFDAIEAAIENTFSLDGTTPNTIDSNIDLDSNRIINLGNAVNNSDAVTLQQVSNLIDSASSGLIVSLKQFITATAGQTVFNLTSFTYFPGGNNLSVYIDGVRQYVGLSYTETNSSRVTFTGGLTVGSVVEFVSNEAVSSTISVSNGVQYQPAGTGAVATTVQAKLRESVSVLDFIPIGTVTATTNCTPYIQAAINSVGYKGTVFFPYGQYLMLTGAVIAEDTFVNLIGDNAVLSAGAHDISLIEHEGNVQRNGTHLFSGLVFDAYGFVGVTGFSSTILLKALWENCFFRYCNIGLDVAISLESSVINCGTWRNNIGIQVTATVAGGSAQGNTFVGNTVQEDKVGYLFYNFSSTTGFANNIIVGGVVQGSGFAGIANIGGSISVSGVHFEAMGTGTGATTPIYAKDIPKCCVYTEDSWIAISDFTNSDANAVPQLQLKNARGIVKNIDGFGDPSKNIYAGDSTSTLEYLGGHNSLGGTSVYLNAWPTALTSTFSKASFQGKATTVINNTLPNIYAASNPQIPTLANAVGATINGTVVNAELGYSTSVSYLASAGSTGANRITIAAFPTAITSGNYYVVSFLVQTSTNTSLTFALDSSLNSQTFLFTAGLVWTRVVLAFKSNQNLAGADLYVYPTDSQGATVKFARIHSYESANWSNFNSVSGQILQGHWNPNKWTQLNYSASPTTGTWKLGDIVYNSAPAAGGYIGWVCTTAGTSGTWKTFGAISA